MKKYISYISLVIIFVLFIYGLKAYHASNKYKDLYEKELKNIEAYQIINSGLEGEIREYEISLSSLYSSYDSLDIKLMSTMNELKIADNKIKNLQYQLNTFNKIDTIIMSDTIFIPTINIDTTIGNYWYNINLKMYYPSTIITTPNINSEQYVYIYNEKKYVGGKSKWFFINWFKKTYISTEVKIEEKNPYIKLLNQKFININKND